MLEMQRSRQVLILHVLRQPFSEMILGFGYFQVKNLVFIIAAKVRLKVRFISLPVNNPIWTFILIIELSGLD